MTSLLGAGAAVPAVAAEDTAAPTTSPPATDLVDEQFASTSGRHFGSQVIHHGEQAGYQVTPISQDKAAPGYQRPGNLKNPTDPDIIDRMPNVTDDKLVRDYLDRHLPSANGSVLAFKICMYTHGGPWLGLLPGEKRISFIAACNGVGFKFSSAYGEALADLATDGKTELAVQFMRMDKEQI